MPQAGIRQSSRISKEIAILLIGTDMVGTVFAEQTKTVVLSRHGAGVVSRHSLNPEQELIIRRMDTNREADVWVVGLIGSQSDGHTYGVAFLDANIDFWGGEFPPLTEFERAARYSLIECSRCRNRGSIDHSDVAWEVYAINGGIVRYCKRCDFPTTWRRAEYDADEESVPSQSGQEPELAASGTSATQATIPMSAAQPQNRRRRARAKVNLPACVRRPSLDDDIVVCEDMSRGGLRFKSGKQYTNNSVIEVAVPYAAGAQNIFVSAVIVYVHDLPEQKLFRCGAAYNTSS
jgi:hypothetical protein